MDDPRVTPVPESLESDIEKLFDPSLSASERARMLDELTDTYGDDAVLSGVRKLQQDHPYNINSSGFSKGNILKQAELNLAHGSSSGLALDGINGSRTRTGHLKDVADDSYGDAAEDYR